MTGRNGSRAVIVTICVDCFLGTIRPANHGICPLMVGLTLAWAAYIAVVLSAIWKAAFPCAAINTFADCSD